MLTYRSLLMLPAVALVLAACGAAAPATPTVTPTATPATPIASPPTATASSVASPATAGSPPTAVASPVAALEPWRTATLTDVRSGESFTLADLAGKVVVVEPMAIWCANCLNQQREVATALASLQADDVVYISLDIDPSEKPADLAAYADKHGFDWRFVVAGRELSRQLAQALGDQVLSPPSTPKVIITPDGRVIGPAFGVADAAAVEAEIQAYRS